MTKSANFAADVKRFEAVLSCRQPDLLLYCNQLANARDCLQAVRSIRDCKHHIQLAELIIANRYATLLAERPTDSETGGKMTSSAVATLGSNPLTAHVNDASSSVCLYSFRRMIIVWWKPYWNHFEMRNINLSGITPANPNRSGRNLVNMRNFIQIGSPSAELWCHKFSRWQPQWRNFTSGFGLGDNWQG